MAKSFILSDESINDRGFRIITAGINLDRFKKNPIMLWMHQRDDGWNFSQVLPIGKWENIRKEDGKLVADPVFDENDPFAMMIKSKVENDLLRGCSIGANPVEFSTATKDLEKGQTRATITKCELYEASIVDLPSNKNSVRLFSSAEQTEVPLINNSAMPKDENKFSFKSEADLLTFMKEKFGFEPKGEEPKKEEPTEEFSFKSENSFLSWVKEKFNLQLKEKKVEAAAPQPKKEEISTVEKTAEELKGELKAKEDEIEDLKTQVENLKSSPGAVNSKSKQSTDADSPKVSFESYSSARETYDQVSKLMQ